MPPKQKKEQTLTLEEFASMTGASSGSESWAEAEADFTPSFQTSGFQTASSFTAPGAAGWVSGATGSGAAAGGFTMGSSQRQQAPIPDSPPYTARVGNVSYDVTEQILQDFFAKEHHLSVESVRLPRGEDGRVRGSAYVDFSTRDGLVAALKLGGSQILGRTVSMNTVEQRGAGFGGAGGAGGSFDWSRRQAAGPTDGSGLGGGNASGDKYDRFRPKQRADEPSFNWGQRAGPTDGSGLADARRERGFGDRGDRGDRFSDRGDRFGDRFGDRGDRGDRGSGFDWSQRAGPTTGAAAAPRPRRQEGPALNWGQRTGPSTGEYAAPRPRRSHQQQPSLDWSKRSAPGTGSAPAGSARAAKEPATAPAAAPAQQTKKADPLLKMQRGFNALSIDGDDEDEAETGKPAAAAAKPEARPISEIQQEQRETSGDGWNRV